MKPCPKNKKLIVWLVMDALDSSQAAELEAHLRQCEGCRSYRAEIASVSQRVSRLRAPPEADVHAFSAGRLARSPVVAGRRTVPVSFPSDPRSTPFNWGLAVPALTMVALALLVLSVLRSPTAPPRVFSSNQTHSSVSAPTNLLPTLGHYRAVANDSFDQLDDLLLRQSQKPVPAPPAPSAAILASLQLPD